MKCCYSTIFHSFFRFSLFFNWTQTILGTCVSSTSQYLLVQAKFPIYSYKGAKEIGNKITLSSQSLQKNYWGERERNHVLNLWVSFSTPSLQSPATFFAPSLKAKVNSAVLCCKSCADLLAFEMAACRTSSACVPALVVHSFRYDISKTIFWMILLIISLDFPLKSTVIALSLSIKFSALLTVPSTENCFPALSHETPAVVSSRRSSSTTTLMPCLSQRSLASSKAFACSLALLASSSAQTLDSKITKFLMNPDKIVIVIITNT